MKHTPLLLFFFAKNHHLKESLRIMRISIFLLFVAIFQLTAVNTDAQNTEIEINTNDLTVKVLLTEIERQSDFLFLYRNNDVDVNRVVHIKKKTGNISSILEEAFANTDIRYEFQNKYIVLAPNGSSVESLLPQQNRHTVSGIITDKNGEPVIGANVSQKGTTNGTISDINGNFSIMVSPNTVLIVSYIGYITQDVNVGDRNSIKIELIEDTQTLDEIVVIGYGSVKKSDLTGAVSSVSSKDFGDRSASSVNDLLAGKASGVQVTNDMIHIRGVTTINNTSPLVVIDGLLGGSLNTIHPSDIESIEVLKDASSTAIYGARGANGVILVNTKKGNIGKPQVDFNSFLSLGFPSNRYDLLKAHDYMDLLKDIELNGGTAPEELYKYTKLFNSDGSYTDYVLQDRTNWDKEIQKNSFSQEYTLSIRGGAEKATYSVSGAFNNNNSTAGTVNSKVYILGENTEFKLFKNILKVGQSVRLRYTYSSGGTADMRGLRMPSYSPVYDENVLGGHAVVTTNTDLTDAINPTTGLDRNINDSESRSLRLMAQFYGELNLFPWLKFNTLFGVNIGGGGWSSYTKANQNGNVIQADSEYREGMNYDIAPRFENYLTLSHKFGVHDISLMIGNSYENNIMDRNLGVFGKGFLNDELRNVMRAKNMNISSAGGNPDAYLSYFGRFNYSLMDKYLVTFNFRADGSSRFGPSNRWGKFPSVAVGWKVHEEAFMKNVKWINQLKLRGSYGITGNDGIDRYMYYSLTHSNAAYAFPSHGLSSVVYNGTTVKSLTNPNIKWEETKNISIGLDLGFLENRLQFTADYFTKKSYDILFQVPQAPSLGLGLGIGDGNAMRNAADVTNKGFEFNISYKGMIGDLNYQVAGNGTYVKNKVTGLGGGVPYTGTPDNIMNLGAVSRTEEGYPIGYFYGFKMDKVYATQAEVNADNAKAPGGIYDLVSGGQSKAGDIRYIDVNGDGVVDLDDRTYLGSSIPKFSYGFSTFLEYKGIDFNMSWYGVAGNSLLNGYESYMDAMVQPFNTTTNVLNRWRSESEPGNGIVPRAVKGDPGKNTRMSDRYVYKGSYLRLDLISLGYTLPKSWMAKTNDFINSVRFYVSSDRLFTITGYPGVNPVVSGSNTVRGVDVASNLANRTLRFGVSVKF